MLAVTTTPKVPMIFMSESYASGSSSASTLIDLAPGYSHPLKTLCASVFDSPAAQNASAYILDRRP